VNLYTLQWSLMAQSTDAVQVLSELGRRLVKMTLFLFQRISVTVQQLNSVLLHDGFIDDDLPEYMVH